MRLLPVLLLCGLALAAPSHYHAVHERRSVTPSQWVKVKRSGTSLQDVKLPMRVSLKQRNIDFGHDHLLDISDPKSKNYGKHWTAKEVAEFFSPSRDSVESVHSWLESSGIDLNRVTLTPSGGSIVFHATVPEAEILLNTKYDLYEHTETGALSISCEEYSLHHSIRDHVDFVSPTINFHTHKKGAGKSLKKRMIPFEEIPFEEIAQVATPGDLSNCDNVATPACIKALYGIPTTSTPQTGNELGIYEDGDYYNQADLNSFYSQFAPAIPAGTAPILNSVDGGTAPLPFASSGSVGESLLDFELAFPIVFPQNVRLFQTFDQRTAVETLGIFDAFLDALDASFCTFEGGDNPAFDPIFPNANFRQSEMCGTYTPPHVISISYGLAEATYSVAYNQRQCQEYMKLGLQGTSVIFASGDSGTSSAAGASGCLSGGRYNPDWAGSCPFITAVGATQIAAGNTVNQPEVAVRSGSFTSGGGFSNDFARPSYQNTAVAAYLSSHTSPPTTKFNASGRAYPDLSAIGLGIAVVIGGQTGTAGGTSASAPIVGSIITLINQQRIAAGKSPVGFLNPTLYANPGMFNDITSGVNLDCNLATAFSASTGWDPVTGLGTPNYAKMLSVFMALP